jgi:hypothetical protein
MEQAFSKIVDLLFLAKQKGIEVVLNEERLQLRVEDNKTIDKNIVEQIKENKEAIIKFLSTNNWNARKTGNNHNRILLLTGR